MPVLNGEQFIEHITGYIRAQTFGSYEALIIVSSKSTDDTLTLATAAMDRDPCLRVIVYEDTGALGGSKNMGIDSAIGKYLWFLDVDDVPSLRFLDEMVRIKEEHGADLVGCNFVYSDDRLPIPDYEGDFKVKVFDGPEALRARATERFPVTSWSMLYDAEVIRRNGLRFPDGICEDIGFTYSVLGRSRTVCYYEKPLYKYVITPTSVTRSRMNRDMRGQAEIGRYDRLETMFEDQFLRRRFALLRVRSAGHMSVGGFLRYIRSDRCVDMVLCTPSFEGFLVLAMPLVYFVCIRLFFLSFYYRPGRAFTGGFFRRCRF